MFGNFAPNYFSLLYTQKDRDGWRTGEALPSLEKERQLGWLS
tara:strand:- start:157 stop:282 length:126 start_codon:yes stop_codon:yes gene_type:complete